MSFLTVAKKIKIKFDKLTQHVILDKREKLSSILNHGGHMNTQNYTTYTGTFVKRNGQARTMTFIKGKDVPTTVGSTTTRNHKLAEGYEIVFDVEKKGFRMFNWGTVQGTVSQGNINISFDNVNR